jgi:(R,R)-butanediol dehydrogenase/meso-butanediol dehydrogenase/diacetyl reductase
MPAIVCGRCHFCRRGLGTCAQVRVHGLSAETGARSVRLLKDYQVSTLPDDVSDVQGRWSSPRASPPMASTARGVRAGTWCSSRARARSESFGSVRERGRRATVVIAEPNPNRADWPRDRRRPVSTHPGACPTIAELTQGIGVDVVPNARAPAWTATALTAGAGAVDRQTGPHPPAALDGGAVGKDVSLIGSWCYLITDWPRIIRLIASASTRSEGVTARFRPDGCDRWIDVLIDPRATSSRSLPRRPLSLQSEGPWNSRQFTTWGWSCATSTGRSTSTTIRAAVRQRADPVVRGARAGDRGRSAWRRPAAGLALGRRALDDGAHRVPQPAGVGRCTGP